MHHSYLLFLSPIIILKLPLQIICALLLLTLSTLIYHNNTNMEIDRLLFFFDQMNIINTCCIISFESQSISVLCICLYFIETILFKTQIVPFLIFFLSSLRFINNFYCFYFFFCACSIYGYYLYHNIEKFDNIDRYIWHLSQVLYITIGISKLYPFNTKIDFLKNFIQKK